jgi:hypothetical protein
VERRTAVGNSYQVKDEGKAGDREAEEVGHRAVLLEDKACNFVVRKI